MCVYVRIFKYVYIHIKFVIILVHNIIIYNTI